MNTQGTLLGPDSGFGAAQSRKLNSKAPKQLRSGQPQPVDSTAFKCQLKAIPFLAHSEMMFLQHEYHTNRKVGLYDPR